jgi:GDP-L-fucose synthase
MNSTLNPRHILVTGSRGFLGRHVAPVLAASFPDSRITAVGRNDFDLMDPAETRRMLEQYRPDAVVHLAAYVGGIGANRTFPADFYYRNTMLTANMFEAASRFGVSKLVYTMGGCSYPARAPSPIAESEMWNGYPQPESAAYSTAKKMGLVASAGYRAQYGLNSIVLVPGNMYGEYDNFRNSESHVVPALIRRFLEAGRAGAASIPVWGSGRPVRDFVYAADVAALFPFFIREYHSSEPVNLSSGTGVTVRELAETIRNLTGFPGEIAWNTSQPDGQMLKVFDVSAMRGLGLSCPTPLEEGLRKTIQWFRTNYESEGDGLRLSETSG